MQTDAEIEAYLRENGYPEHVCGAGRAGLIAMWGEFVGELERGYPRGLEDYRRDLDLRAILALAGLDAQVQELDARFERMVIARHTRVWESGPGDPFWDFGYPGNASGALLEDLKAEGLA
jgi:hypothetical protein